MYKINSFSFYLFSRAKHPCKVDVWAGISWEGRTPIVIFQGKMNAVAYISVLEAGLKPFLSSAINVTKFMQDNDPKHSSRIVGDWMDDNNI